MHGAMVLLTWHSAYLTEQRMNGIKNLMYDAMKEMEKVKGRLLHYFPPGGEVYNIIFDNNSGFPASLVDNLDVDHDISDPLANYKSHVNSLPGMYIANCSGASIHVAFQRIAWPYKVENKYIFNQ